LLGTAKKKRAPGRNKDQRAGGCSPGNRVKTGQLVERRRGGHEKEGGEYRIKEDERPGVKDK